MNINNISSIGYSTTTISRGTNQSYHLSNPPNFGVGGMPTKSAPIMSDADFKIKIEELAKRDVAAGRQSMRSPEFDELKRNYVSVASPDRQGIINSSLSSLAGKLRMMAPRLNFAHDLLSLLMGHSNSFSSKDIGTNFIQFRDVSGNLIARYSELPFGGGMGWEYCPTKAEIARSSEFAGIYNEAFRLAQSEPQRMKHNEIVMTAVNAKVEYTKLATEAEQNSSPDNIAARDAALAAYEAAHHTRMVFEERV